MVRKELERCIMLGTRTVIPESSGVSIRIAPRSPPWHFAHENIVMPKHMVGRIGQGN